MISIEVRRAFDSLVAEYQESTGFDMPWMLREYLVELLASRLEDVDIIPRPSFAERYLELYHNPRPHEIREFGDQCLFFVSLMPRYGQRRGLNKDYYCNLGISSYYAWGDLVGDNRGIQLGNWFYHLHGFLEGLLHKQELSLVKF